MITAFPELTAGVEFNEPIEVNAIRRPFKADYPIRLQKVGRTGTEFREQPNILSAVPQGRITVIGLYSSNPARPGKKHE